ncbi:MAPK/MAK/MRK overlapping kinase-like [Ylistrum balloti]|uniref:MAPK/MAK/MRK overlapping kinase-like n=1 Tax=Ylistrum balloti TaxID=509963 RepID=UPI002905B62A|nr:MAPK/MAK/MRK overlapping kinase-like [Ylistrum balloti]
MPLYPTPTPPQQHPHPHLQHPHLLPNTHTHTPISNTHTSSPAPTPPSPTPTPPSPTPTPPQHPHPHFHLQHPHLLPSTYIPISNIHTPISNTTNPTVPYDAGRSDKIKTAYSDALFHDKKSGTLVLICELMDMNIYELIRGKRHYLPERKVKHYMYQLLKSVEHMHRNGIFHRDVKPENILIKLASSDKEDVLKLADFGSCRSVYSKQPYTEYISTRWYRAPECLLTDGYYTYKMDIWSVGCVFFEILSLHPLFPGSNEVDQIAKIHDILGTPDPSVLNKLKKSRGMNFNFPHKKGTGVERLLPHVSSEAVDLIYQMCTYDPDERMSAKQAIRHSYFRDLREADKRQAMLAKAKQQEEKEVRERKPETIKAPPSETSGIEVDTSRTEKKKTESQNENRTMPSLPKAQSLPTHPHFFKDRRKKRHKRLLETHHFSNHTGLNLPKVPMHANSLNPSFHASSFSSYNHPQGTTSLSLLPSINATYKPHKPANKATKNIVSSYQLPSLDRRGGAGF